MFSLRHAAYGECGCSCLSRYSDTEDRLDIMARMLEWRHIVPTSPDTLVSYPFKMDDPFALTATPHVLFAGNQPAFGQRLVTGEAHALHDA